MSLNSSKTKTVLISKSNLKSKLTTREKQLNIELNGTRLEQVDSVKLLGLEIDEELSFDNHTDSLSKKFLEARGSLSPEQILMQK